jgi:hypothetical protein
MTDAEKVFNQTVQERKRIARGEKNKIKGGGRAVRLPSDNLTKKEREAMNGETVTYKVHSPVKWPEFKRWPPDIQREYFKRLDTSYRPTAEMYAAMFGVSKNSVSVLRASLGVKTGNRGRKLPDAAGWQRFTNRGGGEEEKAQPEEAAPETLTIHNECEKFAREQAEQIDVERIAGMLRALIGTGAKLTIEVTL